MQGNTDTIRGFVARMETIDAEIRDRREDRREIVQEAKAAGIDTKALNAAIRERAKDPAELAAFEDLKAHILASAGPLFDRVA